MEFIEKNLKNYQILFILFLLGFLIYSNVINGPFLFDDMNFIVYNKYIHSLRYFFNYFNSNLETGAGLYFHLQLHNNFYRPLQELAHGLIYHFFGLKVQAYHIFSILLHIINSFLVFLLLKKLSFSKASSFIASLIFLMHPVQVEAVSYISGLSDPLSFIFMLSAILIYLNCYDSNNKLKSFLNAGIVVVLFCLSMLSKESAFIFCFLTILLTVYLWKNYSKTERSFRLINLGLYVILACIYIYLKLTVFNFSKDIFGLMLNIHNPYADHLYVRLFTFISILAEYVKLLFFPLQLYYEKLFVWYENLYTTQGVLGLLIIITSIIAVFLSYFRKKIVFLGISWFFICIAPFSGLIVLNATYLEHWLYFAIVGSLIIFASIFDRIIISKNKTIAIYLISIVLTLYGIRVITRNNDWSDEIRFYKNELIYNPICQRSHSNLALRYFIDKRYFESIKQYKIAISLNDKFPECHNNLGVMYMEMGKYKLSEDEFYSSLKINPNFIYSINGLSSLYYKEKQLNKSKNFNQLEKMMLSGFKADPNIIDKIRKISN